jgi:hypothetical protein
VKAHLQLNNNKINKITAVLIIKFYFLGNLKRVVSLANVLRTNLPKRRERTAFHNIFLVLWWILLWQVVRLGIIL